MSRFTIIPIMTRAPRGEAARDFGADCWHPWSPKHRGQLRHYCGAMGEMNPKSPDF